jgi:uncharacterized protein YyaL (SSP411 family)
VANHLAGQTSPYLLQHVHNPVDWRPWGAEALALAKERDRPIFLSIGYAACHWCHVMERESFESEEVAAFLNSRFVPIKVDREERPDLDEIYMSAVQILTGAGGWPLSVFLTPDLEPFFGGTYFPPDDRYGRPGFLSLLRKVDDAWRKHRPDLERSAAEMRDRLRALGDAVAAPGAASVGRRETARAAAELAARFDDVWGGFGNAPKFPPSGALALLLREHARSGQAVPLRMVEETLDRMALGGMYDQIGGGFARYSTDERWLVPHFEKMLYDQALLVPVYVDAHLVTRKPLYRRVALETLDFVRRELTSPGGGFLSSLDADSEGHEGKFYVFTVEEIRSILGERDADLFCEAYGISAEGNFEGKSIPNHLAGEPDEATAARLVPLRAKVLAARETRVRPATDDKVLTAWNGLMIGAFARGYQAFAREEDLRSARGAADFVLSRLVRDGRLLVSWREDRAQLNAYLDDHAFLARGLLDLYEASFDTVYLDESERIARVLVARFQDGENGGFFFTSDDHEVLLTRSRSLYDGATPAGAGVAAETLLRLAIHLDDPPFRNAARSVLAAAKGTIERAPSAFASTLAAADLDTGPTCEIAIVGALDDPATLRLLRVARERYLPNRAIAAAPPGAGLERWPLLRGKVAVSGKPTAYLCRSYACEAPVTDPARFAEALGRYGC